MTASRKPIAIFPDLPRDVKMVDEKGEMSPDWHLFFEQLITTLQTLLKPEGTVIPQLSTSDIGFLTGTASVANIVYDSTANVFKGNVLVTGIPTWKTFTTS